MEDFPIKMEEETDKMELETVKMELETDELDCNESSDLILLENKENLSKEVENDSSVLLINATPLEEEDLNENVSDNLASNKNKVLDASAKLEIDEEELFSSADIKIEADIADEIICIDNIEDNFEAQTSEKTSLTSNEENIMQSILSETKNFCDEYNKTDSEIFDTCCFTVSNLPKMAEFSELSQLITQYGKVDSIENLESDADFDTVLVTMESGSNVDLCIKNLNNTDFNGNTVTVQKTSKPEFKDINNEFDDQANEERKSNTNSTCVNQTEKSKSKDKQSISQNSGRNLWLTNLLPSTKAQELKQLFSKYGKVNGVKVVQSSTHPTKLCYGYVTMDCKAAADICIRKLDKSIFKGQIIHVSAVKKEGSVLEPAKNVETRKLKDSVKSLKKNQETIPLCKDEVKKSEESIKNRKQGSKSDSNWNSEYYKIREECERELYRERERIRRDERKIRQKLDRLREMERRQLNEAKRLTREKISINRERERLERQREEIIRIEQEKQSFEREKLEKEKQEFRREQLKFEEEKRTSKHSSSINRHKRTLEPVFKEPDISPTLRKISKISEKTHKPHDYSKEVAKRPSKEDFKHMDNYQKRPTEYSKRSEIYSKRSEIFSKNDIDFKRDYSTLDMRTTKLKSSFHERSRDGNINTQYLHDPKLSGYSNRPEDCIPTSYRSSPREDRRTTSDSRSARDHRYQDIGIKEQQGYMGENQIWQPWYQQNSWTGPVSSQFTCGSSNIIVPTGPACPPPPGMGHYGFEHRFDNYKSINNSRKY